MHIPHPESDTHYSNLSSNSSGTPSDSRDLNEFATRVADAVKTVIESALDNIASQIGAANPEFRSLLTPKEVSQMLRISQRTLEKLIGTNKLRPIWVEGQRRFHPDTVNAYLRSCMPKVQNTGYSRRQKYERP